MLLVSCLLLLLAGYPFSPCLRAFCPHACILQQALCPPSQASLLSVRRGLNSPLHAAAVSLLQRSSPHQWFNSNVPSQHNTILLLTNHSIPRSSRPYNSHETNVAHLASKHLPSLGNRLPSSILCPSKLRLSPLNGTPLNLSRSCRSSLLSRGFLFGVP